MVDGTHYLKGMAVYSDTMPDGVDVIFNTNKKSGTPTKDVLKKIKDDPDNPFGSLIKEHGGQSYYDDPKGKYTDPVTGKKQSLSLINKRAEEGDWGEWSKTLPSQFLSKQSLTLIKKQLGLSKADKQAEYDEICSLTNPTVKKALLKSFADDCDAAAVHLQAAALPRQKYQVILPLTTIKDNEVYAPNYKVGTVANSCSTMHKIQAKEFTLDDFSCEHLNRIGTSSLWDIIDVLNAARSLYLKGGDYKGEHYDPKDKQVWWQMIQLLPSSYNQTRNVMMNYEVLANIYKSLYFLVVLFI